MKIFRDKDNTSRHYVDGSPTDQAQKSFNNTKKIYKHIFLRQTPYRIKNQDVELVDQ